MAYNIDGRNLQQVIKDKVAQVNPTSTAPKTDYAAQIGQAVQGRPRDAATLATLKPLLAQRQAKIDADPTKYASAMTNEDFLKQLGFGATPAPAVPVVNIPTTQDAFAGATTPDQQRAIAQAAFDNYLKNWKPDISKEQFVTDARNVGTTAANLKYDSVMADLKQRVANIINQYSTQLGNVDNNYSSVYQENAQNSYDAKEAVRRKLARAGMLNSGVDVGNTQQVMNTTNMAKQKIDLQKQGEKDTLNNNITDTNRNLEMDLNQATQEKGNFLANVEAQAAQDYMNYMNQQKQFMADNYWKGANYAIDSTKVNNDLVGMKANYGLESAKLSQSASQFATSLQQKYDEMAQQGGQFTQEMALKNKELAVQNAQFYDKLKQEADNFKSSLKLDERKLEEDKRQFDDNLGFQRDKMGADLNLGYAQVSASLSNSILDANTANARLSEEMRQFNSEFEMKQTEMGMAKDSWIQKENARVDEAIINLAKSGGQYQSSIPGIISSSNLPDSVKQAKLKMIQEAYGIVPNNTGSSNYYRMLPGNPTLPPLNISSQNYPNANTNPFMTNN